MLPVWKDFLVTRGAVIEDDRVTHFGNPGLELAAAKSHTILADLSHFSLLEAQDEDAPAFLHGQFTNDVMKLTAQNVQLNGYCSPKGRLLATFLLWKEGQSFRLQLPRSIAAPVLKRLSMFVLRSKVKLADVSNQTVRLSIAGAGAKQALIEALGNAPSEPGTITVDDAKTIIALTEERFMVFAAPDHAAEVWNKLAPRSTSAGSAVWDWLAIRAGEPVITPATQEQFVPQMVNFELLGGVNFQKGCYPGQEIVARMQYLGKLKRRMYLVHLPADNVAGGQELLSADLEGQASGMIVNAAPSPDGGTDALAVIQIESALNHPIHWKTPDGPLLKLLDLPYPVA